eukprot:TRINITY_DN1604_c0_g1_i1.p1 TRINITY_DN1604_c0_g1~~TRINITY_DN1604_c0_g1_i1.p1  ORF type:complete len:844 (-),score=365.10 TRINITY_DN1604_c0_g1_i1:100-2631(-)
MAPPAEKKAKTEGAPAAATAIVPDDYVEVEKNAAAVKGSAVGPVAFHTKDTTMNVLASESTGILSSFSEGGFAHLLAGARGSAGVKAGRVMFEVSLIEHTQPEGAKKDGQVVRIGFSTTSSSLLLGDTEDSVCFDLLGAMLYNKTKTAVSKGVPKAASVLSVVLNLDKKSANGNTISLFVDGVRHCTPQELPEKLQGKTLFPSVTYRNTTLHVNFGPQPRAPLPFTCHMIQGMETSGAQLVAAPAAPADGKYEVLFPVGLPEEGAFDWLDSFLEKNPQYTELSDRALSAWAEKSGFRSTKAPSSKDKPEANFGMTGLDANSYKTMIKRVAPMQERSFILMSLQANLLKESRAKAFEMFPADKFKLVAQVVVGEPPAELVKKTHTKMLAEKQDESNRKFKVAQQQKKNARLAEKKKKEVEKAKKKAEAERKKKLAEAKKAAAAKAAAAKGEEPPEDKEEEPEPVEEEEEPEEEVQDEMEVEPPTVELTAEEKKVKFYKDKIPDLAPLAMSTSFSSFTMPTKDEGFAEIRYAWTKQAPQCDAYLKKWIIERKVTTRVEDIKPSSWFNEQHGRWNKEFKEWQQKVTQYKNMLSKKEQEKKAKAQKKVAAAAKAKAKALAKEAQKKKLEAEGKEIPEELLKEDEPMEEEPEEPEAEEVPVDFEELDIFGIKDVNDLGGGMPLCKEFGGEDWAMCGLRFELSFLVHAFAKDSGDEDRTGIYVDHLAFYYKKYFKKDLTPKAYGVEKVDDIVALVDDTVHVTGMKVLETMLPSEMEKFSVFLKLAEEARRRRNLLVASGDDAAKLKLQLSAVSGGGGGGGGAHNNSGNKGGSKGAGGWGMGKGFGKGFW